MAQRPQVRQFQAPTQADIRPAASPVDTFVAPAKETTQPSPLSQFLTAITPAIEADANQRKVDRLKREKEVADGIARAKENQIKQQARKFLGTIAYDYMVNEEAYKEAEVIDVYEKIRADKEQYIGALKESGVDNLLALKFDEMIEAGTETFMQETLRPAKYTHTQGKLLTNFQDGVLDINNNFNLGLYKKEDGSLDPEAAMADIAEMYTTFHQDNNDFFTPSDNKVNAALDALVIDMKDSQPFSIIGQYMESTVHSKGQYGTKALFAKSYDDLKQARAATTKKNATAVAKSSAITSMIQEAFATQSISAVKDRSYIDPNTGKAIKITKDEVEAAILSSPEYLGIKGAGNKLAFLAKIDIVPTKLKGIVLDGVKFTRKGNTPTTPEDMLMIENATNQYQAMKNAGMDMSWLDEDARKKMDALHYIAQDMAMVGERTLVDDTLLDDPYFAEEAYTQKQDFNNAATIVQMMDDFKGTISSKELREQVTDGLKAGWMTDWLGTELNEVFNTESLTTDIVEGAYQLYSTGAYQTIEQAAKVATNIAKDDYKIVESSDGTDYAFKHLNTDYTTTMDVTQTVNTYNKVLPSLVSNAMFAKHSLEEGEFAVGLYPDIANPNAVVIRAYDTSGDVPKFLGTLGGQMDKRALFTNEQQLNMLVAKSLEAANIQPVTTYTGNDLVAREIEFQVNKVLEGEMTGAEYLGGGADAATSLEDIPITQDILNSFVGLSDEEKAEAAEAARQSGNKFLSEILDWAFEQNLADEEVEGDQTSMLDTVGDTLASAGTAIAREFGGVKEAAASTLIADEGFEASPYDDMGKQSVGYGFQMESLEEDEKALIEDINNVKPEEADAVLNLKVDKLSNWWDDTVEGFSNLPESSQVSAISMAYQLGKENVAREWPKFMASIKEAAQYAEGSVEQTTALAKAKFNMLYNVAEDGAVTATKWATQTTDRAMRMAEGMAADVAETAQGMFNSIIPEAQAATLTPMKVGDKPDAEGVVAVATSPDPVTAAMKYMGISESSKNGSQAVKGFFDNAVGGEFAPDKSAYKIATTNAWCAAFLAQVLADSGIDVQKAIGGRDRFDQTRAKAYLNIGEAVDVADVKAGDIMVAVHSKEDKADYFKKKGKKLTSFGHVGVVVEAKDGELYYIGGNTGDKVKVSSYGIDKKDLRIRRLNDVKQIPREQLPSLLEMEYGKLGKYADKIGNFFTGLYDNVLGN